MARSERQLIMIPTLKSPQTKTDTSLYLVRRSYVHALEAVGLIPVLVNTYGSKENLICVAERCSGIVFAGGVDWNPKLYGQEPEIETQIPDDERDRGEQILFDFAIENNMPILAICRGMQGLAVAGQRRSKVQSNVPLLIQHVPNITPYRHGADHYRQMEEPEFQHEVMVVPGTRAFNFFPEGKFTVGSAHHQAVNEEAIQELGILAVSGYSIPDRLVSVIEFRDHRFGMGFQDHIEADPSKQGIFKPVFQALRKNAEEYEAERNRYYVPEGYELVRKE